MKTFNQPIEQYEAAQVQFRLAMYGCATSVPMFLCLCSYFVPFDHKTRMTLYNIMFDLGFGLSPWLLVVFSKQTRIEFFKFLPNWAKKAFVTNELIKGFILRVKQLLL